MVLQTPPGSGFTSTLTRIAVSQICNSVGFNGAQNSTLQVLTDITAQYLQSIAKLAAASANSHGRTESNIPDIIVALEDLAAVQGFAGASILRARSLYSSSVVKDLMKFVKYSDEIPFAQALPPGKIFFQSGNSNLLECEDVCVNSGGWCEGRLSHVPRWLPSIPKVEEEVSVSVSDAKWGEFGWEEENKIGVEVKKEGNEGGVEVLERREGVRFKIGLPLLEGNGRGVRGGGVGREGGIGKRVQCSNSWNDNAGSMVKKRALRLS